jgi:hypothetical protein
MLSAVVFTPDAWISEDLAKQREIVVRSLVWLVSAVVAGIVRDVTLAVPAGLGLSEVADQSGCGLVQRDAQADRLSEAARLAREERQIVLMAGFQPDHALIEEIEFLLRDEPERPIGLIRAAPTGSLERLGLRPGRVIGVLTNRAMIEATGGQFSKLVRAARRQGRWLDARARPMR